jgi:hypothetical protein
MGWPPGGRPLQARRRRWSPRRSSTRPAPPRGNRPELPERLEDTILKALEKDRTLRCQSASELRADLKRLVRRAAPAQVSGRTLPAAASRVVPAPPSAAPSPPSSDVQLAAALIGRHRLGVAMAALVLMAVIGAALALVPRGDGGNRVAMAGAVTDAPKAIAVLPFANVSPERDQEYFADGISDQLSTALARIPDLQVTGRTSAFHFKGRNEALRTIGEALGVQYLLTGSVRKAGDRVRITPELE